jgi:hypothetical protein
MLALCEEGAATKYEMVAAAAFELGLPRSDIRAVSRVMTAHAANGKPVLIEDEADALGLALVGLRLNVVNVEA